MLKISVVKFLLPLFIIFIAAPTFAQTQACPVNIDFSAGDLTQWNAYTGNNRNGNGPGAIFVNYSSGAAAPSGTIGATTIGEYNLNSVPGVTVINSAGTDYFGGFRTIPTINGYQYKASILLGSTSITQGGGQGGGGGGGYVRGVSYLINVPAGPATVPYTMTYAYAMVLENGTHNSSEQPVFSATLSTSAGIIDCASPQYYLPTFNNATNGGRGALLDTATAVANGFKLSINPTPNADRNGVSLYDVWTKGWTEVTFDLSPYRGQQVTLTFETDNCVPGGHFAYSYVALRNTCAGLVIDGYDRVCTDKKLVYSVPALANATYQWNVPAGWQIVSGSNTNILTVTAGTSGGTITVREQNSCADLNASININTVAATVAGKVTGDNMVCTGTNASPLVLSGYNGNIMNWLSSSATSSYATIANTTPAYNAQNLTTTTLYQAVVQNGPGCDADTSSGATVTVFQKSDGGMLSPANMNVCLNQDVNAVLTLTGNTGSVVNWQISSDDVNWSGFNPVNTDSAFSIIDPTGTRFYRTIVKNGVCPADTSAVARAAFFNISYPKATITPEDTTICYGTSVELNATITTGTRYNWTPAATLSATTSSGSISTPLAVSAVAAPLKATGYVLNVGNAGCPNTLQKTFNIQVTAPIILNAGNDTTAVVSQPLQLNARTMDTLEYTFVWTPSTGLNSTTVANPVAVLTGNPEYMRYMVTATSPNGCTAEDDIKIRIFTTLPDIFVPNAFTPGRTANNLFRPIGAGISSLQFFRIYNRWGQLVYTTSTPGEGWDGVYNGQPQSTGSYVWMLSATSYKGEHIIKKGTMTLVRTGTY